MGKTYEIGQSMISIKINGNQVKKGLKLGVRKNLVTAADQAAKRQRDVETAKSKTKASRLGRIDTAGQIVFDGGNLLFLGRERGKEEYLSPANAVRDLVSLGYHISSLEIMVKEGDKTGGFLRIQFSATKPSVTVPNEKASAFIDGHLNRVFRAAYGYINPAFGEDPINTTFNFAGPVIDETELTEHAEDMKDLRILSMNHPGHASCVRRK